jgi:hypothetical protein
MYFGIRSNDGKELYFSGADKIMAVPIQNTESFQFGTPQPLSVPTADLFGFTPGPLPLTFGVCAAPAPRTHAPPHRPELD